jgi:hypothetical protein
MFSLDFVDERLSNGQKFRVLTVVAIFSRDTVGFRRRAASTSSRPIARASVKIRPLRLEHIR